MTDIELATLAFNAQLYIPTWQMECVYQDILNGKRHFGIVIHMENNAPVACATINKRNGLISCFVLPQMRSQGIGKRLIHALLKKYHKSNKTVYACFGIKGSEKFYQSCQIAAFEQPDFVMSATEAQQFLEHKITLNQIKRKRINERLMQYTS